MIAALGEGRMRTLWGMGICSLICLGLVIGTARAGSDDDEPASKPRYGKGPGLMDRLLQAGEKPAEKKPAPKKDKEKAEKPSEKPAAPAPDSPVAIRAREQAAWERRMQICMRLMDLANQTNDEELYRRAEELEQRAWEVYRQRTAHLPVSAVTGDQDEETLDRHLTSKSAAAKLDAPSSSAKNRDKNAQAAIREVKP